MLSDILQSDNSLHILVVESSVDFGECISIALDATPFKISVIRSRYEAVQALRRGNTFDLMQMDWSMPGIPPELFTRWVARYSPNMAVIAMSADPEREIEAKAAGISAWLSKPFTPDSLMTALDSALSAAPTKSSVFSRKGSASRREARRPDIHPLATMILTSREL